MVRIIIRGLSNESINALKDAHESALARSEHTKTSVNNSNRRAIRAFLSGMASAYDITGNVGARMREERVSRIRKICNAG